MPVPVLETTGIRYAQQQQLGYIETDKNGRIKKSEKREREEKKGQKNKKEKEMLRGANSPKNITWYVFLFLLTS